MRYKLAILNVLANQPGGRATRDEVRRQAGLMIASLDQIELKRFSSLGDIDIFHHGLVARDDAGLQITEAGMALLAWLASADGLSLDNSSAADSADEFKSGDEHFGLLVDRNLGSANAAGDCGAPSAQDQQRRFASDVAPGKAQGRTVNSDQTRHFGIVKRVEKFFRSLGAFIATKKPFIINLNRRRFASRTSIRSRARSEHSIRSIAGAAFGLFALLFVVAAVLAAIAFGQIQSLKSDVAVLRRELLPLKERVAKFDQAESQKRDQDQQEETQNRSDAEKKKADGEVRNEPASLNLNREESQLIRDYIKPALTSGIAAPEINVGDTVGGATIPLPSPLTEKIPKLQGARFTTRNGSIIIVRGNSRQAEAILGPN